MNGFINLNKPSGTSSAFALNCIKRKIKNVKVGHTGTLDPMASGVLPVAIGKSTRLFDYMLDKKKVYIAEFTFGYETDTLDKLGNTLKTGGKIPPVSDIEKVIPALVGSVMQVPPSFSAKNVSGVRSYDLARKGIAVDLPPKKVEIYSIILKNSQEKSGVFTFEITCGGGTYIRSIARDMAKLLNAYCTMTALERVKSGVFDIKNSVSAEEIKNAETLGDFLIPPDKVIDLNEYFINEKEEENLYFGRPFFVPLSDGFYAIKRESTRELLCVGGVTDKNLKIKVNLKE